MASAHGTWSRYTNDRCRCPPCRAAAKLYGQRRKAGLLPERVPAGPVIERLHRLREHGFTYFQLRYLSGADCHAILHRDRRTVDARTAERIFGIQLGRGLGRGTSFAPRPKAPAPN